MTKEEILRVFMQKVWNQQRKDLVEKFIAKKYKIHLDTPMVEVCNHSRQAKK